MRKPLRAPLRRLPRPDRPWQHMLLRYAYQWRQPRTSGGRTGCGRAPTAQGGTRLDVKMSYLPPAGAVGHVVAKLFGADPRSEIIADLLRMKSFIETGHQPHDAAARQTAPHAST